MDIYLCVSVCECMSDVDQMYISTRVVCMHACTYVYTYYSVLTYVCMHV